MRVTGKTGSSGVGNARPVTGAQGTAPAGATSAVAGGPGQVSDALNVSGTAQFIAVARAHLDKVPDIRHAKVDAIRNQLDRDAYQPDGEAVADGLVREHTTPRKGR